MRVCETMVDEWCETGEACCCVIVVVRDTVR